MTRVAIYARFSSMLQDERSIDDQVRVCRERAEREGWTVTEVFPDYAISGTVRDRPGLNMLLQRSRDFDVVLAEALDRISRDQEDVAHIFKRLRFSGSKLVTLLEGEVSELHIGMTGTMSAMALTNMAAKIRRGQTGRVMAGRIPGGLVYGYRKVVKLNAKGEPELGLREIDEEQASVIRRVYAEKLAGRSGLEIVKRLNADHVPSPAGGIWNVSAITGDPVRLNGILRNPIYAGELIYNRTQMVRDPQTRRRVPRVRPQTDWIRQEIPELAIISRGDFDAVQASFAEWAPWSFQQQRRPKRLLSGLAKCGCCGGTYTAKSNGYWRCSNHHQRGGCANGRTIRVTELEGRVLGGLQKQLLDPELVSIFVREYHATRKTIEAQAARDNATDRRRLADAEGRIARLVEAIADGTAERGDVADKLKSARAIRDEAAANLASTASNSVIALHPRLADDYRRQVEQLATALADPERAVDALPAARSLIEQVTITPREDGPMEIEVVGRLASIISLATGLPMESSAPVYAAVGSGGGI